MLKTKLLHPEILSILGSNGHGSRILIADSNFPFSTCPPSTAKKVFLNFAPGMLKVTDVVTILKDYIPIEAAIVMVSPDDNLQPIHLEFEEILGMDISLKRLKRFEFYEEVKSEDTCLVIATGETKRFANILLFIGVVKE
ncbi:MAG TPA: RbsD/FucU family protein [Bacteroidales bacterium]|nr:RbsD/FucU family protein [Bacteroidales bacterium]